MKCSVTSRSSWSKNQKVLTVGSANVFIELKGIEDGMVVVPVQLKYIKQNDGKLGKPLVDVRQPQYQDKKSGKYRVSYLSVHLNGAAAQTLEKLVNPDWLKGEIKRLFKTSKAGDYELSKDGWKHTGDRSLTSADNAEDEDFLTQAVAAASELASKAEAASETAPTSGTAADDQAVADEVLGK